jgi:hypothetical protein
MTFLGFLHSIHPEENLPDVKEYLRGFFAKAYSATSWNGSAPRHFVIPGVRVNEWIEKRRIKCALLNG